VLELQKKLVLMGLIDDADADGIYGKKMVAIITAFQQKNGLKANGIANMETQSLINYAVDRIRYDDPNTWIVSDEDDEDD